MMCQLQLLRQDIQEFGIRNSSQKRQSVRRQFPSHPSCQMSETTGVIGERIEDPEFAILQPNREPCCSARLLLYPWLSLAEEIMDTILVPRLRLEGEKQRFRIGSRRRGV